MIGTNRGTEEIVAVRLDTAERIPLWTGRTPRYVSTGHVVFSRDDALWAVPFDPQALRATGEPVPIARGVLSDFNRFTRFAVAPELLVYQQTGGADPAARTVAWVERDGTPESLALPSGVYTFHPADDYSPIWTPDGQRIVFGSWRSTDGSLFWRAADGSGSVEPVLERRATQIPNGWTAGGRLVFTEWTDPGYRLFVTRLDGSSEPEPLLADGFAKLNAAVSPAGDMIAYESDELGPTEIFVRSFPALAGQRLLSTVDVTPASGVRVTAGDEGVGHRPVWSRDGDEVYYQNQDALLSVRLSADGTSFGAPDILFQGSYFSNSFGPHFDVAPDGRFVMILTGYGVAALSADAFTNELVVVQNWLEEVRPVIER